MDFPTKQQLPYFQLFSFLPIRPLTHLTHPPPSGKPQQRFSPGAGIEAELSWMLQSLKAGLRFRALWLGGLKRRPNTRLNFVGVGTGSWSWNSELVSWDVSAKTANSSKGELPF